MQMEYFWKQQDDLPAGTGYGLFSKPHIISTFVVLVLVATLVILISHIGNDKKERINKTIPVLMLILEIFKDLYLVRVGHFGIGYLPLHVCSIGIFIFLIREYLPSVKIKEIFGEIAFILIMPASVCALVFPDWAELYPVWNFMNLYSYLWHGLLVLYPFLLKTEGKIKPILRHIHYEIIFLLIVVPPILLFDKKYGCNYFFVNWPLEGTPLAFIADTFGTRYYLVGYGILTIAVLILVYVLTGIIDKLKKTNTFC